MVVVAAAADTVGSIREAYRATWMRASIGERARGPCSVVRGEGPANRMNDGRMRARETWRATRSEEDGDNSARVRADGVLRRGGLGLRCGLREGCGGGERGGRHGVDGADDGSVLVRGVRLSTTGPLKDSVAMRPD